MLDTLSQANDTLALLVDEGREDDPTALLAGRNSSTRETRHGRGSSLPELPSGGWHGHHDAAFLAEPHLPAWPAKRRRTSATPTPTGSRPVSS